ncbi:hypothetical protein DXG01_016078 [Tephrocybe rancida]|nr:hypothetical protein DXG01_016078 [Tephrocybe rancida]
MHKLASTVAGFVGAGLTHRVTSTEAPINKLPLELLEKIFLLGLRSPSETKLLYNEAAYSHPLSPGGDLDPLVLALVSHDWKALVLKSPQFWSSIYVRRTNNPSHVPLLKIWLERSGGALLTIKFVESYARLNDPRDVSRQLMALLVAEAYRWETIEFRFRRMANPLLSRLPNTLQTLRSASVLTFTVEENNINETNVDALQLDGIWRKIHSISLKRACWDHKYLERNLGRVPWLQLTSIDMSIPLGRFFESIPDLPGLVDLRLEIPSGSPPIFNTLAKRFPSLRNYTLVSKGHSDHPLVEAALSHMVLPGLVSLTLVHHDPNDLDPTKADTLESIAGLLIQSQCRLKQFSYYRGGFRTDANAEEMLKRLILSPPMRFVVQLTVQNRVSDMFAQMLRRSLPRCQLRSVTALQTRMSIFTD